MEQTHLHVPQKMEVDEVDANQEGEIAPNATIYVRNINDRVTIPALKEALHGIFGEFGEIQEIIAKKSIKRRGQAFIVYDDIESAQKAIEEIDGFEIYGKQLSVEYAKTKSDITVKNEDGEEAFEAFKKERISTRERKEAEEKEAAAAAATATIAAAEAEALDRSSKKRELDDGDEDLPERPAKLVKVSMAAHVPDEYLPPNKTLMIRDLPAGVTSVELQAVFSAFPKFKDARTVPNRPIAFIEYADAAAAEVAKRSTVDLQINGHDIKANYRRGG